MKKLLVLISAVVLTGIACQKEETYPIVPDIKFEKYIPSYNADKRLDSLKISISFTDGDGDIGLGQEDTIVPYQPGGKYYYNLIMAYFEMKNGKFVEVNLDGALNARIPYIPASGINPGIKGQISIDVPVNPFANKGDTVRYTMFIYDRALHQSNTVTTPDLIL